jgi:uncharacterized membrane protein
MRFTHTGSVFGAAACIGILSVATVAGAEQPRAYAAIDVPGATLTNAQGINSRGDIVGFYVSSARTHGFLLSEGTLTAIDYPGAAYTDARGINARGEIVGAYRLPGEPAVNFHGYLRSRDGEFVPVNFPGHTNTIPQRITSSGLILGCRHDNDLMATMRGMMINGREQTEVADIEAFASMNNGSTPDGSLIIGLFTDMDSGTGHGYLLYGQTFWPFDVPGSTFTAGWDVNARGQAVGVFRDAANAFHGFLWDELRFTSIDYPAAAATRAFGISARGAIVGAYIDSANRTHGFVATSTRGDDDDR